MKDIKGEYFGITYDNINMFRNILSKLSTLWGFFFICVGLENIQMVIYVDVVTFCSCVDTNTEYQMF